MHSVEDSQVCRLPPCCLTGPHPVHVSEFSLVPPPANTDQRFLSTLLNSSSKNELFLPVRKSTHHFWLCFPPVPFSFLQAFSSPLTSCTARTYSCSVIFKIPISTVIESPRIFNVFMLSFLSAMVTYYSSWLSASWTPMVFCFRAYHLLSWRGMPSILRLNEYLSIYWCAEVGLPSMKPHVIKKTIYIPLNSFLSAKLSDLSEWSHSENTNGYLVLPHVCTLMRDGCCTSPLIVVCLLKQSLLL